MDFFVHWDSLSLLAKVLVVCAGFALGAMLPRLLSNGGLDRLVERAMKAFEPLERFTSWIAGAPSETPSFRRTGRQRLAFMLYFVVVVGGALVITLGVFGALGHIILPFVASAMIGLFVVMFLSLIIGALRG